MYYKKYVSSFRILSILVKVMIHECNASFISTAIECNYYIFPAYCAAIIPNARKKRTRVDMATFSSVCCCSCHSQG